MTPEAVVPTLEGARAVVGFLPALTVPGAVFFEWDPMPDPVDAPPGAPRVFVLTGGTYAPSVDGLLEALYAHGFVCDFDWVSWREEVERYVAEPSLIARADLVTVRRLITAHARSDRYVLGHFASVLQDGTLAALLRRVAELYAIPVP